MPSSTMYVRDTTNNKNVILEVDGSNQLNVKDITAQGSLSTISAATANISADQATATNQSTANMSLSTIESSVVNLTSDPSTATLQTAANLITYLILTLLWREQLLSLVLHLLVQLLNWRTQLLKLLGIYQIL